SGPSAHRSVDQVADLLTGGCEGGGIASPVDPVGANGAGDFQRHVFLSELLEDLDVVEVFDAVAQPFQTHGGRDAGNADLLAGIDKHAFARVVRRSISARVVHVVPWVGGPLIDAPVEHPGQVQALADESRLNAEIDGVEIDQPLRRVRVLYECVVGPDRVAFLEDVIDLGFGVVVHDGQ